MSRTRFGTVVHTAVVVAVAVASLAVALPATPAVAAMVFTVNTAADAGDGTCDVGECTLREALTAANASAGHDVIAFSIAGTGPHTISPASRLPAVSDPVTIDGASQPGFTGTPLIELSGAAAGIHQIGLKVTSGGSTIRGLAINRWGTAVLLGVSDRWIEGAPGGGNVVAGNFIGLDPSGTEARPNTGAGVMVNYSFGNTIGGTAAADRNVISASYQGVVLSSGPAGGDRVIGNIIGLDVTGARAIGEQYMGVRVGGHGARVGGTTVAERNVISGNVRFGWGFGVFVDSPSGVVEGNYIGLDATGTASVPNGWGISFSYPNQLNEPITAHAANNLVSGNNSDGIEVAERYARTVTINGNTVGLAADGMTPLPNGGIGIDVSATQATVTDNTVAGNAWSGVQVVGNQNVVRGNRIGTSSTGDRAVPNATGIVVSGTGNIVGGSGAADGNIISGNLRHGLILSGDGPVVLGNRVGVDRDNNTLPNGKSGIYVGASNSTIGAPGAGNIVGGNAHQGILFEGNGGAGSVIRGNAIGTDPTGTLNLGNAYSGIELHYNSDSIRIGGMEPGEGNLIAHNGSAGEVPNDYTEYGDGFVVENGDDGVFIESGVNNLVVGNAMWGNAGQGIDLGEPHPEGSTSWFNAGGPTANDSTDSDTGGGNNRQNHPVIAGFTSDAGSTTLSGALHSTPSTEHQIDLYADLDCTASGRGQGRRYLGHHTVTTDVSGDATFEAVLPVALLPGEFVTATASGTASATDGTSEFSPCPASAPVEPVLSELSPSSAQRCIENCADVTVTVRGSGFDASTAVVWNGGNGGNGGTALTTTFVSATELQATVPGALLGTEGTFEVGVVSGGTTSGTLPFFVTGTAATISNVNTATSTDAQGQAVASTGEGGVTATADGAGSVTVAAYSENPTVSNPPTGASNFFDVYVSSGSEFGALTLVNCNLTPGNTTVYWYDPAAGAWLPVTPQTYDSTTGCVTMSLESSVSSPTLTQLTGTVFAIGDRPDAVEYSGASNGVWTNKKNKIVLSATVSSVSTACLAGRSVQFKMNDITRTGTTDASGKATAVYDVTGWAHETYPVRLDLAAASGCSPDPDGAVGTWDYTATKKAR